MQTISANCQI